MRRQKEGYRASLAKLTSKTLRLSIICIFTVFPMVSTTIFQVNCRTFVFVSCFCVRSPSPTVLVVPPPPQTFSTFFFLVFLFALADFTITTTTPCMHVPCPTDIPVRYTIQRLGIFGGGLQDPARRPHSPYVRRVRCLDGTSVLLWDSRRIPLLSEQEKTGDPDASDAF